MRDESFSKVDVHTLTEMITFAMLTIDRTFAIESPKWSNSAQANVSLVT